MRFPISSLFKILLVALSFLASCKLPQLDTRQTDRSLPASFSGSTDSVGSAAIPWRQFFQDSCLISLIDTALAHNREFLLIRQEVDMARFESEGRKGAYLPALDFNGGAEAVHTPRFTPQGAAEEVSPIEPGKKMPEAVADYRLGTRASWEIDLWKRLRNGRQAAIARFLATSEGQRLAQTRLITEIATVYYELMSLDNQLSLLQSNLRLQQNALEMVRLEKSAARVTELAVKRFEAEVAMSQSRVFEIQQRITEAENQLRMLSGGFPGPVRRMSERMMQMQVDPLTSGIPARLLENRPDIRQAEQLMKAANLELSVAKAAFYPSLSLSADLGLRAYRPALLGSWPESALLGIGGGVTAPLLNRYGIKAAYRTANARKTQAILQFEQLVRQSMMEVENRLALIRNLGGSFEKRSQQVDALNNAIENAIALFRSARADYMEVLLTQRDALEARVGLVETRQRQLSARVSLYQALGGGWR